MKAKKPKMRDPYALHAKMKKHGPHKKKETRTKQKEAWKRDTNES